MGAMFVEINQLHIPARLEHPAGTKVNTYSVLEALHYRQHHSFKVPHNTNQRTLLPTFAKPNSLLDWLLDCSTIRLMCVLNNLAKLTPLR